MFLGSYRHQVDGKGRVAVPAQFRRGLPDGSVVAYGPEGRLVIRTPQGWAALEREHAMRAETPAEERLYLRTLYASAREVELDGQGRLLIHDDHRRWAQISDRAVFVGMGSVVEIVGEEVWDRDQGGLDAEAFTALNDRVIARPAAPAGGLTPTA